MIYQSPKKTKKEDFKYREFFIKSENCKYNLRIEVDNQNISFILIKNGILNLDIIYKTKVDLGYFRKDFYLNAVFYSDSESFLTLFDNICKNNGISIKINSIDSCSLLIKLLSPFQEEIIKEIQLFLNINNMDNVDLLCNTIKLMVKKQSMEDYKKTNNINYIFDKLNKRDEEFKEILNQKDIIIKEMEKKIIKQDQKLNELITFINQRVEETEKKVINTLTNEINKQNEIINKQRGFIEEIRINQEKSNKEIINNNNLAKSLDFEIIKIKNENNQKNSIIINDGEKKYLENENIKIINNFKDEIDEIKKYISNINNKVENFIKKNNNFNNEINFKIKTEDFEKGKNDFKIMSESNILEETNNKLNINDEEKIYNEIKKRFTFYILIEKDKIIKLIKDKKFDLEKSIDYFKEIKKLFEKFDEEFSILSNFSGDDFFEKIIEFDLNEEKIREWVSPQLGK